eukprot:CAMPEP_0179121320 /NCGR_PEP_ID=MMETSP0796-20121207/57207_1 /TAXON_ID=73915 /ORGANISM="Pyrodinium bahamense, Strain pbaha01" /LENGTH=135 /DNA_ID=CAMNT_0020819903 /DNA_START=74 /DNA_END=478 /DNA_ORIENTATION=-
MSQDTDRSSVLAQLYELEQVNQGMVEQLELLQNLQDSLGELLHEANNSGTQLEADFNLFQSVGHMCQRQKALRSPCEPIGAVRRDPCAQDRPGLRGLRFADPGLGATRFPAAHSRLWRVSASPLPASETAADHGG